MKIKRTLHLVKAENDMERRCRMPPLPRLIFGSIVLLPLVTDEWVVIEGWWMLPGGSKRSTAEVIALAASRHLFYQLIDANTQPKGSMK